MPDDFHYKGWVIEAQSYKSDGDRWRPKASSASSRAVVSECIRYLRLDATHDTEEDANAYAVAMAKKWIDDRG
jgi:hypothetical protein